MHRVKVRLVLSGTCGFPSRSTELAGRPSVEAVMQESQKYIDVIVKLNRLTKEGKLSWIRETLISPRMTETYKTRYQDKYFLIYQPPYVQVPSSEIVTLYSSSKAILEIVDEENNTIFTFPRLTVINDLFDAIITMNEEVDSYLDDFLKAEL